MWRANQAIVSDSTRKSRTTAGKQSGNRNSGQNEGSSTTKLLPVAAVVVVVVADDRCGRAGGGGRFCRRGFVLATTSFRPGMRAAWLLC